MAAIPCRDCVTGTVHDGTPTGTETTIHGIRTYVTRPDEGQPEKGLIVFITDIFGWKMPNNRLLADRYAKKGGYVVYIPDFLRGPYTPFLSLSSVRTDSLSPGYAASAESLRVSRTFNAPSSLLYTIFIRPIYALIFIFLFAGPGFHGRRAKSEPLIFNFMRELRDDPGTADLKIGIVGYCWGGLYAVLLAQNDSGSTESKPLVDAAFTGHPVGLTIPEDVEKAKAPLSMALAENDGWLKPPAAERLRGLEKEEGYEVVIFPGTNHGFALRVDPKDEVQTAAAERAEEQALVWFKKWLG